MVDFRDLVIKAWDSTESCPDSAYVTSICPSCLASKLQPLLDAWYAMEILDGSGQVRRSDKQTSQDAAKLVKAKATTARIRLLEAHSKQPWGMTDEEAMIRAGLSPMSEYRTRCSELMRAGVLEDSTDVRLSSAGIPNVIRRITRLGQSVLQERWERENSYPGTD